MPAGVQQTRFAGRSALFAQSPVTFRYLCDDAGELYRVPGSTGALIEYTYVLLFRGPATEMAVASTPIPAPYRFSGSSTHGGVA